MRRRSRPRRRSGGHGVVFLAGRWMDGRALSPGGLGTHCSPANHNRPIEYWHRFMSLQVMYHPRMAQIDRVLRSNIKLRHLQLVVALDEFRHLGDGGVPVRHAAGRLQDAQRGGAMLGVSLFERSTRGTEPTASGHALVRFARSVLAEYERTRDEIAPWKAARPAAPAWARWWWPCPRCWPARRTPEGALGAGHGAGRGRRPHAPAAQAAPGRTGPVRRPARAGLRGARPGDRGALQRADVLVACLRETAAAR
jgi:hypothetical protein